MRTPLKASKASEASKTNEASKSSETSKSSEASKTSKSSEASNTNEASESSKASVHKTSFSTIIHSRSVVATLNLGGGVLPSIETGDIPADIT